MSCCFLRRGRLFMGQDIAGIGRAGGINGHRALVDVLDNPVFVDHKRSAIAIATFLVEDAVVLDHRPFEIAE